MIPIGDQAPRPGSRPKDWLSHAWSRVRGGWGTGRSEQGEAGFHAPIAYLRDSRTRPRADSEDPSRSVMPTRIESVFVRDLRRSVPAPSLDREGFVLLEHRSSVSDFTDPEQLENIYLAEAEDVVRNATGAACAWALPCPVLRSESHKAAARPGVIRDGTAPMPHIDHPVASIPLLIAAAAKRRARSAPPWSRFVLYNLWRSLREPPQDRPLVLCDLRTVDSADLVAADAVANPGGLAYRSEFLLLLHNERHLWCCFSNMVPEELLLFQQLDSAASGPSGCPHASVSAPCLGPALPRLSLEARVCALFD